MLLSVLSYALVPIAALVAGAVLAAFRPPGSRVRSYTHHLAAGVVFAALTTEILPQMMTGKQRAIDVILGFSAGVALMLLIRHFTESEQKPGEMENVDESPASLLAAVGIDVLIDGLLLGIGFGIGRQAGVLLTIALTIEILFLGLATAAALRSAGKSRPVIILIASAPALPLACGAALGATLLAGLGGRGMEVLLSFAAAALLYLVTEELLTEAHEVPETHLSTATFFAGFLVLFLIKLAMS